MLKALVLAAVTAIAFSSLPDLGYPGWTCPSAVMQPSAKIPTSAHQVRFADIKVIGALGDSLTAANGAGASHGDPLAVILQYRGLAFQIGGDKGLDQHVTITNVLLKFNPKLVGYSTGIGSSNVWEISQLNQAVPGAETIDMPGQARRLVSLMQQHSQINIKNDWKLVNIFIGANDMCAYCDTNGTSIAIKDERLTVAGVFQGAYDPQTFKKNLVNAVQILKDNLPRTIVSLTGMLDMGMLRTIDKNKYFCDDLHVFECPCEKNKAFTDPDISAACHKEMAAEQEIQDQGTFDTSDDFTFVIQPFFNDITVPPMKNGEVNMDWFAPDCFHFSQLGHANVGKHLWNNINQPVGMKQTSVNLSDPTIPLNCPDPACPYFRTTKNSQNCVLTN